MTELDVRGGDEVTDETVIMSREEGATANAIGEILEDGVGDRGAVVGGRAATQLVDDDERVARRVPQDHVRLVQLHVERRLAWKNSIISFSEA